MESILLVIHLLVALALIGLILIQRSEGGGLGIGGGGMGSLLGARGTANLLTRATAILATAFIATSILLAIIATHRSGISSIADTITAAEPVQTAPAPGTEIPDAPLSK
ncbi:MAG: preprotein translocase subunit SecG [Dongiaceae bacterium]